MQYKIFFAAMLASSATAVPWGPGGRWGTEGLPQQTGASGNNMLPGPPGMQQDLQSASAQPTGPPPMMTAQPSPSAVPDTGNTTDDSDSDSDSDGEDTSQQASSVPTLAPMPTFASHNGPASAVISSTQAPKASPSVAGKNQFGQGGMQSPSPASTPGEFPTGGTPVKSTPAAVSKPNGETNAAGPSAAAQPSSSGSASTGSSASTGNPYADMVVAHHNIHRANHSSPDVAWNASLASTANKIAQSCTFAHNMDMDGGGYGQNIYSGASSADVWQAITGGFYNGEFGNFAPYFGQADPTTNFASWGHLTQVVWKGTTTVGCATVDCPSMNYTVCNYMPPGNWGGQYGNNVGKPLGKPTVNTAQVSA